MVENEIKSLLTLLEDPDPAIYKEVSSQIAQRGLQVIPILEKVWETSFDDKLQGKLEELIHQIQYVNTENSLKDWHKNGSKNLLEGAVYLAQLQYPELRLADIDRKVQAIADDIWMGAENNYTAIEKTKVLNHVIFEKHGFSRNSHNFYSPQNCFINDILQQKKGNPISLGLLYLCLSQKLGLPIKGVNLPKNFIVAYQDVFRQHDSSSSEVLFYINPYNKGNILKKREIDVFLEENNIQRREEYYACCTNEMVIRRLISNLKLSYEKLGFKDKIQVLTKIEKIF